MRNYRAYSEEEDRYVEHIDAIYPDVVDAVRCINNLGDTTFFENVILEEGLKIYDVHNTEIFVGDKIEGFTKLYPSDRIKGIVVYMDGEYLIEQEDDKLPLCSFHIIDRQSIEIIGTKHDKKDVKDVQETRKEI